MSAGSLTSVIFLLIKIRACGITEALASGMDQASVVFRALKYPENLIITGFRDPIDSSSYRNRTGDSAVRGQRLNLLTNEPCAMNIIHGMEKKCKCFFADCRLRTGIDDIYSFYKYPPLRFLNPGLSGERHPRNDRFFEMAGAWCRERHPRNDRFFEMAGAWCGERHPRNDRFFEMAGAWRGNQYPRNDRFFKMAGAGRGEWHPRNDRFFKMAGAWCRERHPRNDRFFKMAGTWSGERHPRNDRIKKEILLPEERSYPYKTIEGILF